MVALLVAMVPMMELPATIPFTAHVRVTAVAAPVIVAVKTCAAPVETVALLGERAMVIVAGEVTGELGEVRDVVAQACSESTTPQQTRE